MHLGYIWPNTNIIPELQAGVEAAIVDGGACRWLLPRAPPARGDGWPVGRCFPHFDSYVSRLCPLCSWSLQRPTPPPPGCPCFGGHRGPCPWVGAKSPRCDGLRCQRRRPRAPLPSWRRCHDPDWTPSSSTRGIPRSALPDRAAAASPHRSPLEGAA